jgi:hypothetical protein
LQSNESCVSLGASNSTSPAGVNGGSTSAGHPEPASRHDLALRALHLARAREALPGPHYYGVLYWIHQILKPENYVEIGINTGESLAAAAPGTLCIGIDPEPRLDEPPPANTRIFPMTSDEFFAHHDLAELVGRDHIALAFIDGLHLFEQALLDFINLERYAGPRTIIVLHDCLPLDRATSARTRTTEFYSGDVWKLTLCLREQRPDLHMVIVPATPTGLCLVTGLDPKSTVLRDSYEACVARYIDLDFDDYQMRAPRMPAAIQNKRAVVTAYLEALRHTP